MSVVVLASAKASPGVTTTAVGLAACWPDDRKVLLVEADPDGGVLAARHQLPSEPGLATLAVSSRRATSLEELGRHTQRLSTAGIEALVAPPSAEQARRAIQLAAPPLAALLPHLPQTDVLIDVGRIRPDADDSPLFDVADAVLVVVRPRLDEVQQLPARLRALRPAVRRVGLLLVGDQPYPPAEVAVTLEVDVVATVADDPRSARVLAGHERGGSLDRSPLIRSVRGAAESLRAWLPPVEDPSTGPDDNTEPPIGATTTPAREVIG